MNADPETDEELLERLGDVIDKADGKKRVRP